MEQICGDKAESQAWSEWDLTVVKRSESQSMMNAGGFGKTRLSETLNCCHSCMKESVDFRLKPQSSLME